MILCVGTTPVMQRTMVFARVQVDAVNRALEVHETASGKSINVARVAHTLGEEVVASGFLGGDSGKFIRDQLDAAGIAHDFVEVAATTRMCVTVMDQASGAATELVEEAHEVETIAWDRLRGKIEALLPRAKMVVLSGSLPPDAPQDFYRWCVEAARGVRVIVDASGEPLRQALAARPFLVKPNRAELAKTLDVPVASEEELGNAVRRLNADWAVITQGKAGAVVSDGARFWRASAPRVEAINPIGSGDSLAAGLAVALVQREEMPQAVKLGIACGAANAMTKTAGVVDRETVTTLRQRVGVAAW